MELQQWPNQRFTSQEGDRNPSLQSPNPASGTIHVASQICAQSVVQSLAAGKLTYAESFLLHAEDDTIMIARKNETERMPALMEMITLETIN